MEQLAQFVTKSFEFNNCFSSKLLEAKQKTEEDAARAVEAGQAFLSFGLSAMSSSSSASNGSSNNLLLMDTDDNEEPEDSKGLIASDCGEGKEGLSGDKSVANNCEEAEIDIETDSMSDLEDNKRLIVETQDVQERLRVLRPTDLRIPGLAARLECATSSPASPPSLPTVREGSSDRTKDVNNNNSNKCTVIKPPMTKNWLIPDETGKGRGRPSTVQEMT